MTKAKKGLANLVALQEAINRAGSMSALGRLLGITPQAVKAWRDGNASLEATRCVEIEKATGVSRKKLRPDIFS